MKWLFKPKLTEAAFQAEADLASRMPHLVSTLMKANVTPSEAEAEGVVKELAALDPTGEERAAYMPWIVRRYSEIPQGFRSEFFRTLNEWLPVYDKIKQVQGFPDEYRDINRIKRMQDFTNIVEKYQDLKPKQEQEREQRQSGQKVLKQEGDDYVVEITTPEAAATLCRDMEWCVKDPQHSTGYLQEGPLYLLYINGNPRILYHSRDKEMKNAQNEDVTASDYAQLELSDYANWPGIGPGIAAAPTKWAAPDKFQAWISGDFRLEDLKVDTPREAIEMLEEAQSSSADADEPELELEGFEESLLPIILQEPNLALRYWKNKYQEKEEAPPTRWPALETAILDLGSDDDGDMVVMYAQNVLKNRWPQGEHLLQGDALEKYTALFGQLVPIYTEEFPEEMRVPPMEDTEFPPDDEDTTEEELRLTGWFKLPQKFIKA